LKRFRYRFFKMPLLEYMFRGVSSVPGSVIRRQGDFDDPLEAVRAVVRFSFSSGKRFRGWLGFACRSARGIS
jgi:hypothetical protein